VSGDVQQTVFTIGVPYDIYAFYRYTVSSICPYIPLVLKFWIQFPVELGDFISNF